MEPNKLEDNGRNPDGTWKVGHHSTGSRPKGKTIKERLREYLQQNPEKMDEFIKHFAEENRELGWQMLEGSPRRDDKMEHTMPQNIIDLFKHANEPEDTSV